MKNSAEDNRVLGSSVWLIVLSAAIIAGVSMGLRQVMGLYLKPVSDDLTLGREVFAFAIAVSNIVWGIAAPFLGAISDTYGVGRVILFGVLTMSAGLVLLCFASTEWHLFWSGILMGLGVAGAGINAMVGAVGRLVSEPYKTEAIASVGMGSGIGLLLALPFTHVLMQNLGWQNSLLVLTATALLTACLIPFIGGRPRTTGVRAQDGVHGDESGSQGQGLLDAIYESVRLPSFWLLNAGFFVCGFHVVFYGIHLPAYVSDQGFHPEIAVWGLVAVGLGNLAGTYLAGQWGKVMPKRLGLVLIYGGRALVFLGFLYLPMSGAMIVFLSAILGLLWFSTIPLTSGLVATFFGARWLTMLFGIVFFFHQLGSSLGAWLGGLIYDRYQSYDMMWWISVALALLAVLLHWPIREKPVTRIAEAKQ